MPIWRTQVRIAFPGEGSPGFNTWHFRTTSGSSNLGPATERLADFYDAIAQVFPASVGVSCDGVWNRVDEPALPVDVAGFTRSSIGSGNSAPTFVCVGLQLRTQRPGRSGRGRVFLGPTRTAEMDANGSPSEPLRALVVSALEDLLFPTATDGNFCVYSRKDEVGSDIVSGTVPNYYYSLTTRRD